MLFETGILSNENAKRKRTGRQSSMTKMQYILLTAIIGFYGVLFVSLLCRAFFALWRAHRMVLVPGVERISLSRVTLKARNRAWTRAVWRGSLAHDASSSR